MTTSTFSDSAVASSSSPVEGSVGGEAALVASAPPASTVRSSRTVSILALSLGIVSFFFAQSVVVPLAAVILGVFGLRDEPAGRSFSIWGIVLACVATFGWVVVVAAGALISLPFLFLGGVLTAF